MRAQYGHMVFIKSKFDGLDGKTKFAFSEEGSDFQVICDMTGINFKGTMKEPLYSTQELNSFAQLIGDAMKEQVKLKSKLVTTSSGH